MRSDASLVFSVSFTPLRHTIFVAQRPTNFYSTEIIFLESISWRFSSIHQVDMHIKRTASHDIFALIVRS